MSDQEYSDGGFLRKSSEIPDHNRWSMKSMIGKLKKKKDTDLDDFMVIGIDFGTT